MKNLTNADRAKLTISFRAKDVQNFKDRSGNRLALFPHQQDGCTTAFRVNGRGQWWTLCRSEQEVRDGVIGMAWALTSDERGPLEDAYHSADAALRFGLGAVCAA